MLIRVNTVPVVALDKFLGKSFKDVCKQNGSKYKPYSISSFQKSILKLSFLCSSFPICCLSSSKTSPSRFSSQAMPQPSIFVSTIIGSISNYVFNLVHYAPNDPPRSFHENTGKHQKLVTNHWKGPCDVFDCIDTIQSFYTLSTKKHFVPYRFPAFEKTLDKRVTLRTLYHSSLLKTFVYLKCFFFHAGLHYFELWVLTDILTFDHSKSSFYGKPIKCSRA